MPRVEFVDADPDPGDDEELASGPSREWTPRVTRAVRVGAGAILALVVVSTVIGVLRDGGGSSTPATSPTLPGANQLAPEAPASAFRVDHLGADAPEGGRPGTLAGRPPTLAHPTSSLTITLTCPSVDSCVTQLSLPQQVAVALRAALPGTTVVAGGSTVLHGALHSRQVAARDGRLSVRIRIAPAAAGDHARSTSLTVGAGTTLTATAIERGFAVSVTVSGPDTRAPGLAVVRALAADRRLLTVG